MEHVTDGYRRVNGAMSVGDPSIRELLVEGGTLIKSLIWNPLSYAVVYGRSLDAHCVVQGLLMRKVPATKIILVLPPQQEDTSQGLPNGAFCDGDEVEEKIHEILQSMNMKVFHGYKLLGIVQDNRERLKRLILEEHDSNTRPSKLGGETPSGGAKPPNVPRSRWDGAKARGVLEDNGTSPNGLPQKYLSCRIVITADVHNVDPDVFNSLHGNGLVYDGRLIVDHNFQTTDDRIFGAGSLCEFSRRFRRKNSQRYLKHDGFNGREVGAKLARALLNTLDPVKGNMIETPVQEVSQTNHGLVSPQGASATAEFFDGIEGEDSSPDLLPEFYMPIAKGGFLPGNLHYYRITSAWSAESQTGSNRALEDSIIVTDTLDVEHGKGHFCRLVVDKFGKVDSITYLGCEELQVESLWSLVGLSETFLNHLFVRWKAGDIPDIVEFLTDEWATALFHDRFLDFCQDIKTEISTQEEVKRIINDALRNVDLKEGLSRDLLTQVRSQLPKDSVKMMQDRLLDYLRANPNHLKSYFLPENWEQR